LVDYYANQEKVKRLEGKLKIVRLAYNDNGVGYYLPRADSDLQELVKIGFLLSDSVEHKVGSSWVVYSPTKRA
jgi:hypothetical protein